MKVLQSVRNSLTSFGLYPPQVFEGFRRPNVRIVFVVVGHVLFCIGTTMFFIWEAETLVDYSDSLFACSSMNIGFFMLIIILIKTEQVFKLIESFETIIQIREFIKYNINFELIKHTRITIIFKF